MAEAHRLLLWDVDQTLSEAGSVTKRAYARAFQYTTGMPLRQPWEFDGRTELAAGTQVARPRHRPG
jgi:hypothetical protein